VCAFVSVCVCEYLCVCLSVDGVKIISRRAVTSCSISHHRHGPHRRRHGNLSAAAVAAVANDDDYYDMDDDDDGLSCISLPADVKPPNFFLATVSQ